MELLYWSEGFVTRPETELISQVLVVQINSTKFRSMCFRSMCLEKKLEDMFLITIANQRTSLRLNSPVKVNRPDFALFVEEVDSYLKAGS